ncbi:MAG: Bacterial regulatory protein Fis family, partial [Myxococcaceae bacterium]|nr:Bacterial regulatory protein Fis family [Myxococcaceae bacterium]
IRRQVGRDEGPDPAHLALHERAHIERTLALHRNNMLRTAQALGIARSTLYERIKDYGIAVARRPAGRARLSPSPA